MKNYNLTLEEYNQMFVDQNGVCLICGSSGNRTYGLCVDHCHTTGKVRGLLCGKCNSGLGFFNDNQNNLKRAIKYLKNSL